ncbi:unnamed protein product [Diabrotica balteata]|uniref:Uncharacterized protein n=1 Tax=Diabrotica balteata TaxID=107213 RepID=A0A9N9X9A7_DIABA|nr:unnamed protein product [Diabrotica balteata]
MNSFSIYLTATLLCNKDYETKNAIFLNSAGEDAQNIFRTSKFVGDEGKIYDKAIQAFEEYCKPLWNETYDRYKFFNRSQGEDEVFDRFLTDIKILACNFGVLEDSLVRDKIVGCKFSNLTNVGVASRSASTNQKVYEITHDRYDTPDVRPRCLHTYCCQPT